MVALTPIVFFRGTQEIFEVPKVALLVTGALLLASWSLAGMLGAAASAGPSVWLRGLGSRAMALPRHDPAGAAVLLYLVSATVSTLASPNPGLSFFGAPESTAGLRTAAATTAIYFAARSLPGTARALHRIALAATTAAAVAAGYALLQLAGLDPLPWGRTASYGTTLRVFGTLGHPNLLGAYLAMALPLTVWGAACARRGMARIAWLAVGAISLLALAATLSRAAWAGFAAACVMGGFLWWVSRREAGEPAGKRAGRGRSGIAIATLLAAVAVITLVLVVRSPLGPALATRAGELVNPRATTNQTRLHIWAAGLRMAAAHPILGVGLDAFAAAFPAQRTAAYWRLEWGATPVKAHNEAIQILATQGIFGALAALLVVVLVTSAALRALRSRATRNPATAAVAALAAFAIQDLASFTVVGIGVLAAAMAGWLGAVAAEADAGGIGLPAGRGAPRPTWALVTAFALGVVAMGPLVARPWSAQVAERRAAILPEGSLEQIAELDRAVTAAPWEARYRAGVGFERYQRAQRERGPEPRRRLLSQALADARGATAIEPQNGLFRVIEGEILAEQTLLSPPTATADQAEAALRGAIARDTANAEVRYRTAYALVRMGRRAGARAAALSLAALYPDLGQPLGLLGVMALDEGRLAGGTDTLRLALRADWKGQSRPQASAWSNLAVACLSAGRFQEAHDAATEALKLDPSVEEARNNLALADGALHALGNAGSSEKR